MSHLQFLDAIPPVLIIIFIGCFGAIFGSFFNMLIYRLPRDIPIGFERSKCPSCNHILTASELIPILSYLFQLGKCKHCKKKISPRYMIVELLSVLISIGIWLYAGPTWLGFKLLMFCYIMLVIFFADLETFIIPDELNIVLVLLGLGNAWVTQDFLSPLYGGLVGFGIYLFVQKVGKLIYKQDTFGFGDVKLGGAIGMVWGPIITGITVYMSFMIGGLFGILLIVSKKKTIKDIIPFGPSIVIASLLSIWFSEPILSFIFS